MRSLGAVVVLGFAACSEPRHSTDITATLGFGDEPNLTLNRIASAVSGAELATIHRLVFELFEHPVAPDPTCPLIAVDKAAGIVTVAGDCRRATDNLVVHGSLQVTNPVQWGSFAGDPDAPTTLEFSSFTLEFLPGVVDSYDGLLVVGPRVEYVDSDIAIEKLGVMLHMDLYLACGRDASICDIDVSGVELVGRGGAIATGQTGWHEFPRFVDIDLAGADRFEVDVADNCRKWRIPDSQRSFADCP